ncbi:MAG: hypothetical protein ACR2F1_05155 [Nitrososphaeraceae archaeon]
MKITDGLVSSPTATKIPKSTSSVPTPVTICIAVVWSNPTECHNHCPKLLVSGLFILLIPGQQKVKAIPILAANKPKSLIFLLESD